MRYTQMVFRVAVALTLTASPAAAQFTAAVAPPKKSEPTASQAAQATPGARRDSVGQTALTDMRAWVDSAAGVTAPAAAAQADSTRVATRDSTMRDSTRRDSSATWTSSAGEVVAQQPDSAQASAAVDGVRAPDTATMLPAVAFAGLLMLGAGAWLLRRARA